MTINLGSQIQFTKSTAVIGAGARSTIINGAANSILFRVAGLQQEFRDLGFQGAGYAVQQSATAVTTLNRVRITQHSLSTVSTAYGPVYVNAGDMIIRDSEISGNTSTSTSGNAFGGAVYAQGASTKVTIVNSTIAGNTTRAGGVGGNSYGGGVYAFAATVSVQSSTLVGNSAANSSSVSAYGETSTRTLRPPSRTVSSPVASQHRMMAATASAVLPPSPAAASSATPPAALRARPAR